MTEEVCKIYEKIIKAAAHKGFLSSDKLEQLIANNRLTDLQVEELIAALAEQNIDIQYEVSEESVKALNADSVGQYLAEIRRYPLLTPEEEIELMIRIQGGDQAAYNQFINSNLRLAFHYASKRFHPGTTTAIDLLDVVSEANIGLMKAVEKFKPEYGFRFSTYASYWILQNINRYLMDKDSFIRMPTHYNEMIVKVRTFQRKFEIVNGREPDNQEIMVALDLSADQVKDLLANISNRNVTSLNQLVNNNETEDTELAEFIPDDNQENDPQIQMDHVYNQDVIDLCFENLSEREKTVITLRFGLDGQGEHTLDYVGKILGITRERVRQIEAKTLRKMRLRMSYLIRMKKVEVEKHIDRSLLLYRPTK